MANLCYNLGMINTINNNLIRTLIDNFYSNPDFDEKKYISRAKKGDEEAIQLIMGKYAPLVEQYLLFIPHDENDEEDLLNHGLTKIKDAIDYYNLNRKRTSFNKYCSVIIFNSLVSYNDKLKHPNNEIFFDDIPTVYGPNTTLVCNMDLDDIAEQSYEKEKLLEFMKTQLTPLEYNIICLKFGFTDEGPLTHKQIGMKLGLSRGAVTERVLRILDKFRNPKYKLKNLLD